MEIGLHRHEQSIIVQPPGVFPAEVLIDRIFVDMAPLISHTQQLQAVFVHPLIIHVGRITSEVHRVALRFRQHTLLNQRLQTDEIGVARKGGKRLIGRIEGAAMAGRAQRQNLPVFLSRLLQPVYKLVSLL